MPMNREDFTLVCQVAYQGTYRREAFRKIFQKRAGLFYVPWTMITVIGEFVFYAVPWVGSVIFILWMIALSLVQSDVYQKIKRTFQRPVENNREMYAVFRYNNVSIGFSKGRVIAYCGYNEFSHVYESRRLLILYGKEKMLLCKKESLPEPSTPAFCKQFFEWKIRQGEQIDDQ